MNHNGIGLQGNPSPPDPDYYCDDRAEWLYSLPCGGGYRADQFAELANDFFGQPENLDIAIAFEEFCDSAYRRWLANLIPPRPSGPTCRREAESPRAGDFNSMESEYRTVRGPVPVNPISQSDEE